VNKKSFVAVVAVVAVVVAAVGLDRFAIAKIASASHAVQTTTIDKGADTVIVDTMRTCIVTITTQGLTDAGVNQAFRLCWNRAELVGKTHKGK
jgi:hypothetical protein